MQVAQTAALVLRFIMHFYFPACRQVCRCALWFLFSATLPPLSAVAQPINANPAEVAEQQRRVQEERNQDLRKRLEPGVDIRTDPNSTASGTRISDGQSDLAPEKRTP
jgi:hypothetical protein